MKQIMKANGLDILIKIKLTIVALFVVLPSLATAQVSAGESQPTSKIETNETSKDDSDTTLPSFSDLSSAGLDSAGGRELITANWKEARRGVPKSSFPWVENHGYFRLRSDLFYNFDLDTYRGPDLPELRTSPFAPPLSARASTEGPDLVSLDRAASPEAESLAGANMRFRYAPTVHISESLRIKTTVDLLDNVVLGSQPNGGPHSQRALGSETDVYARPDAALEIFNDGQQTPQSGTNSWRDSVRVKHVWGEWSTPLGLLSFGRTQSHWGLGVLANGGQCLDCDFGDAVDRIMGVTQLFDTYLAMAWDFASEGYAGFSGYHSTQADHAQDWQNQPQGQPYDFDQRDDVNQLVIAIFQQPNGRREEVARAKALHGERELVLDWGFYNVMRWQSQETGYGEASLPIENDFTLAIQEVNGFIYIPDLWLNLQHHPSPNLSYQIQLEAVAVVGEIQNVPQLANVDVSQCADPTADPEICVKNAQRQDIEQLGYALEFELKVGDLHVGLLNGMATGDEQAGFGYLDRNQLPRSGRAAADDTTLSAFRFDRDYHVDLILFRELIGGVTNAIYFKPFIGYNFIPEPQEEWGFTLGGLYASALEAAATPGGESPLGLEFDLEFYIRQEGRLQWSLAYGVLFPFDAFALPEDENGRFRSPGTAQTIQMFMGMEF